MHTQSKPLGSSGIQLPAGSRGTGRSLLPVPLGSYQSPFFSLIMR